MKQDFYASLPNEMPDVDSPGMMARRFPHDEFRPRFDEQHALIKAVGYQVDCIYAGDSLTAGCPFEILLRDLFPYGINRGIGGDSAALFRRRMQADVLQHTPKAISFMIGTNDIAHRFGYDDDDTLADDYEENMTDILDAFVVVGARCFIGVMPPTIDLHLDKPQNDALWRMQQRKRILIPRMNETVRRLVAERGMHLVDYYPHFFTADGTILEDLFRDSCHFNARGKLLMANVLRSVVASSSR